MRIYITLISCLFGFTLNAQDQPQDYPYIRPLFEFDIKKPLFDLNKDQMVNTSRYLRYYALTGYREGVATTLGPFGISFSTVGNISSGTRLLYMYNVSIGEIVTHRVGDSDRIIYRVKDPSRYRYLAAYGSRAQWLRKNGICFEVLLPASRMNIRFVDTLISKRLGITWVREKRFVKALVLTQSSRKENVKFAHKENGNDGLNGRFIGVTFDALGTALAVDGRPFVDETNYNGLVDLRLQVKDPNDLVDINRQLKRYDLVVKEEMRELNMYVVREVDYKD